MIRWLILVDAGALKPRVRLIAENVCLRQQLVVLKRRQKRPSLRDADRRFWVLASRWFGCWRETLLIVQPETVLRWHRKGWKTYWRWRSRQRKRGGRRCVSLELRELICRMYMRRPWNGHPSPGWRQFLSQYADDIWACDLLTVQTVWFRTLYVFFVIHHGSREIIHARVTANPTAEWLAQLLTQACDVDRNPPRYLIHDRDGCFGTAFNRRARSLGITRIRTPVKAPKANAIAERWVSTARSECLDYRLVLGHQHLQRLIDKCVAYYNEWRPHRRPKQRAPLPRRRSLPEPGGRIVADPILGGLHHVYRFAA